MRTRQIERLYKKMITFEDASGGQGNVDPRIRSEIFQTIMNEMEGLLKKLKRSKNGSRQAEELGLQIRRLLLKEVQVIIDEYVLSQQNGTVERWKEMYGDIHYYIKNFYSYRTESRFRGNGSIGTACGFYETDE
ncbi:MAG: hypothetical protein NTY29_10620 [Proteobacteria bacterium]|nr:hypothetical protein [Pseudomonadota bacterium]